MSGNCANADKDNWNQYICNFITKDFDVFVYFTLPLISVLLLLLLILTISLICCCCKQWKRKKRMYVVDEEKDGGKNVIL